MEIMTTEELTEYYSDVRQRNIYPPFLRKVLNLEVVSVKMTDDFGDKPLNKVAAGIRQQLKGDFAGLVVLYKPANAEKGTEESLVIYNKALHDERLAEAAELKASATATEE